VASILLAITISAVAQSGDELILKTLTVHPAAVEVELVTYEWGGGSVSYVVTTPRPNEVLDYIRDSLSLKGWKMISENDSPITSQQQEKYLWMASWRNTHGNQVDYTVSYRINDASNVRLTNMTIYGGFTPGVSP
jgi:hypothetical protein